MTRTKAEKIAQKKYEAKRPVARIKASTKSAGKRFIIKYSTKKDLAQYLSWIHDRLQELDKMEKQDK